MVEEFDFLVDVPAFPAYALPPDAFPGFSSGTYGGTVGGETGIACVEYLYRPDYEPRGRVLGVSNTRRQEGNELLREDPSWWASPKSADRRDHQRPFSGRGRRGGGRRRAVPRRGQCGRRGPSLSAATMGDAFTGSCTLISGFRGSISCGDPCSICWPPRNSNEESTGSRPSVSERTSRLCHGTRERHEEMKRRGDEGFRRSRERPQLGGCSSHDSTCGSDQPTPTRTATRR
jgi:hypothetical protein